ncbi:MAG: class I SAM-dependent methyltransferase, partial [Nanoarchaeota archaeon]
LAGQLRTLPTQKPILEVCAGSGKLAHHLRKQGSDVIATDSYVQRMVRNQSQVEKLKHNAALRKYDPEVVIASWIPGESRIGIDVLKYPSVKHFICIGEGPSYSCGHDDIYKIAKPKKLRFIERFSIGFMDFHKKMSLVQQFDRKVPEVAQ